MFCKECGSEINDKAAVCVSCGVSVSNRSGNTVANSADSLEGYWYAIIWCSLLVPCVGGWIIVLLSSIMYYVWRKDYPKKAKTINLHGWLAFIVGNIISVLFWALIGALSSVA